MLYEFTTNSKNSQLSAYDLPGMLIFLRFSGLAFDSPNGYAKNKRLWVASSFYPATPC